MRIQTRETTMTPAVVTNKRIAEYKLEWGIS